MTVMSNVLCSKPWWVWNFRIPFLVPFSMMLFCNFMLLLQKCILFCINARVTSITDLWEVVMVLNIYDSSASRCFMVNNLIWCVYVCIIKIFYIYNKKYIQRKCIVNVKEKKRKEKDKIGGTAKRIIEQRTWKEI